SSLLASFLAYPAPPGSAQFQGGVFVGVANVNSDRFADVITGAGNVPHVKVFDGRYLQGDPVVSFIALDRTGAQLSGGAVAGVDRTGDGISELMVTATGASGTRVLTLDAFSHVVESDLQPFPGFAGNVFVG